MHTVILFGHDDDFNYKTNDLRELLRDVLPQFPDAFHFYTDFSGLEVGAPKWQPMCMNSKRTSSRKSQRLRNLLVLSFHFPLLSSPHLF